MHRPWIKIETSTPDKPEVCTIATKLRIDPDAVVGKLVRLWSWVEVNHIHSNDLGVTLEFLDKLVGHKGFALAMIQAGWLEDDQGRLSLPYFERHNGNLTKGRLMTAKRVKRHRLRKQLGNDDIVTKTTKIKSSSGTPPKLQQAPKPEPEERLKASPVEVAPPAGPEITPIDEQPVAATKMESSVADATIETAEALPTPKSNEEIATEVTKKATDKRKPKVSTAPGEQPLLF